MGAICSLRDVAAPPIRQYCAQMKKGDDEPGTVIAARYQLGETLGRGGAAYAYRAEDRTTLRGVAIKICRRDRLRLAGTLLREAAMLRRLTHPNIVRVLDGGQLDDGRTFLVLEWVDGVALSKRLRRSPIAAADALDVAEAVLEALMVTHAAGIVHRDVKPHNVLIPTFEDQPLWRKAILMDFDAAAEMNDLAPDGGFRVRGGLISGTPEYIAPEQAMGLPHGPSADVFGVAALLYEVLTGTALSTAPTITTFLLPALDKTIVVPADRVLATDLALQAPDLPDTIDVMLRRDPAARPQSAADALGLLRRARRVASVIELCRR
jgi:eukaryotic-like serine/threonine-protein kinase